MKRLLLATALAAAATAALVSVRPGSSVAPDERNANANAIPAPSRDARTARAANRKPQTGTDDLGDSLTYRLVSTTDLAFSGTANGGDGDADDRARLVAELSGRLRAADVERSDDGIVLQLAFSNARTATSQYAGGELVDQKSQRLADLTHPFYAAYDATGRLTQVYVPPETPIEDRNTMRTVAATVQVSLPPADRDIWSAAQVVAGDAVDVLYRARSSDTYERTFETAERSGRAIVTVRDERLARLQSDERVSSPALGLHGSGTAVLELVARERRPAAVAEWRRDRLVAVTAGVASEVDRAAAERASLQALDDGTAAADLLAMLTSLAPGVRTERDRAYLMRRLAARFAAFPNEARAIGAAVAELAPREAATVVGALSAVGNEQTERALADIVASPDTRAELIADAANALSFHEQPGDAAIVALRGLADSSERDRRGPGLLGLGSVSFRLGQRGDERGDDLVRDLLERFAAATTEQDQVDLLAALGNTGSELILPTLERVLAGDDPRLRHEAVVSLRLVKARRADELLAAFLDAEAPSDLRSAALFAARFRPVGPLVPALSQLVRADPDADTRGEALERLAEGIADIPTVAAAVAWVANNDPVQRLRARAGELLETAGG